MRALDRLLALGASLLIACVATSCSQQRRDPPGAAPSATPREVGEGPALPAAEAPEADRPAPVAYNADVDVDRAGILAEGAEGSGEIALTFDDGPSAENTPELLRILAAHHAKGTFFMNGERLAGSGVVAEMNRRIAVAIARAGHAIGNHGLDHLPLDEGSADWIGYQIEESARRIAETTGVQPRFFRPPYGRLGAVAASALKARGDELVTWTIDGQDTIETDPEHLAHRLEQQLLFAGQGVVLLHDLHGSSVRALSILLAWMDLHPRDDRAGVGFRLVDLETYLADAAARPYPYATRGDLLRARERQHAAARDPGVPSERSI